MVNIEEYRLGLELAIKYELTPRECKVILLLVRPMTRIELGKLNGLKPNNLFSILKTLQNKGLIRKQVERKGYQSVYELTI